MLSLPRPLADWFALKGWQPFAFQLSAWQAFADGHSGLIHAATGTGKTYAAYLGAIIEALNEPQRSGESAQPAEEPAKPKGRKKAKPVAPPLKILWITPLRALAADTAHALEAPLAALGLAWEVGSRTGDTKASERTRQKKQLPTVLITTPESLTLFLSYDDARERFADLRAVVVDEWHELIGSRRGTQTELALARLRTFKPALRTWGVSATLGNLDTAMAALIGPGREGKVIRGLEAKTTVIDSLIPDRIDRLPWAGHLGLSLLPKVVAAVDEGRSALVFTNTRAQTEIWYRAILDAKPDWAGQIALHHGSLDRKVRDWVEDNLAEGKLRCVVCTSSLDLGVDYAPVDRVLQVGSPKGIGRLMQRAGRSGHQPGAVSRITFVPTSTLELIEVAAAREAALAGKIEGRVPIHKPLDVLAQHLVTMALAGGFRSAEMLAEVRSTAAFADLSEAEWQWTLDFVVLGGDSLRAYPDFHRVVERDGLYVMEDVRMARRHRMSLGTIVSESSILVRFLRGARLGTVEEGFLSKLKKGDRFVFAGRTLEFIRVHEMTAWVKLSKKSATVVPRWVGGRMPLSSELADGIRAQLELARVGEYPSPEMQAIRPILELQKRRSKLPAPGELLIERLRSREGHHLFFHPLEGRLVHEGLAALLAWRLTRLKPLTFTLAVNDYGFELLCPDPIPLEEGLEAGLFSSANVEADILSTLNAAEMTRRQFREIARVAGLVFPGMPGAPKSAKQVQATSGLFYEVFREHDPTNMLLKQADREVLERQFERMRMVRSLDRMASSKMVIVELTRPGPLAFPLMVERIRATMTSESLADRVRKMTLAMGDEDEEGRAMRRPGRNSR